MDDTSSVALEIQRKLDRAVDLMKCNEMHEAVSELFAPDAIFVRAGATVTGRDAIEAMFRQNGRIADGWIRTETVRVHGDLAYEVGTNSISRALPDGSLETSNGRYLTVWRRSAGRWLIVADAPMADPA
jgi:uncharacterized protein (TIGR02246 family)